MDKFLDISITFMSLSDVCHILPIIWKLEIKDIITYDPKELAT